jgi:protein-tyrosine phosphatase
MIVPNMKARTSRSDPIRVDWFYFDLSGGKIGVTFAPGKKASSMTGRAWDRDLALDLNRLKRFERVDLLVSLIENRELQLLRIRGLAREAERRGILMIRFPVADMGVPADIDGVHHLASVITGLAHFGKRIVIHCRGGLGRAGTIAAVCLVRMGAEPDEAILRVRAIRPGAIENSTQEQFVRSTWHDSAEEDR